MNLLLRPRIVEETTPMVGRIYREPGRYSGLFAPDIIYIEPQEGAV